MAIAIVLATILVATILFAIDRIPLEVSSLVIVAVLALSGVLTVEEAFAGFSNETVIFIFSLLAMTRGLAFTGIVQMVGQKAAVLGRFGPRAFVAAMMTGVAFVSAFVSNTVTTAALVPVVGAAATRTGVPKSKVLMPLAYASMLGGTLLLFGTSTNLVMSAAMSKIGLRSISVFELLPVGLPITFIGIAIVVLVGPWVLPSRDDVRGMGTSARDFLTEVVVTPDSVYLNKPLSDITGGLGLRVLGLVRGGHRIDARPDEIITLADRLLIEEDREDILKVKDVKGLEIKPDAKLSSALNPRDAELIEASVPAGSPLIGRSLKEALFSERYGLVVLAIHRRPGVQRLTKLKWLRGGFGGDSLSTMRLAVGDVLLARGERERVAELSDGNVLTVLVGYEYQPPRYARALLASVIFGGVLLVGTLGLVNFAVAGLTGVLLMIATGCMDARNAFRVDWRVLVLIGSVLALGTAMEKTGAGLLIGSKLTGIAGGLGPKSMLAFLMIVTVVLSAPMSNQAAALVMLPVAVAVAKQLGVEPRSFAMGICLAASCSFMTPLEPACVLVYGAGRYRFSDFFRLGIPLTAALVAILTFAVPVVWPFHKAEEPALPPAKSQPPVAR